MYKAIVSDVDGTIIVPGKAVSLRTKQAIKAFIKKGYSFSVASGRSYHNLKNVCDSLDLTSPLIFRGGAEIIDPQNGKLLFAQNLEEQDAKDIISVLQKSGLSFFVEQGNDEYSDNAHEKYKTQPFKPLSQLKNYKKIPKIAIVYLEKENVEDFVIKHIIKAFPKAHAVKAQGLGFLVWDITSIKATKHLAVLHVAKMLHISPKEIVGIGDSYNDFPLLEACGLKVAMGNAIPELKVVADYIAPSVEKDGVAEVIEKYFLTTT